MKIFFTCFYVLTVTICLSVLNLHSQTWINTNFYDITHGATMHHDTLPIGPMEMCILNGGEIVSLLDIDPDQTFHLAHIIPATGQISSVQIAHSGGIYSEYAYNLISTTDGGYAYMTYHLNSPIDSFKIHKWSPVSSWTKVYVPLFHPDYIAPSTNGGFYIHNDTSLLEVNANGNPIRSSPNFIGRVTSLPGIDLIVARHDSLSREDFNGNITWLNLISGCTVLIADTNYVYCRQGNNVIKLRTDNGHPVWTKPVVASLISVTSDGGLITTGGIDRNQITRFDSTGNQVWTRNIPFPEFGYRSIIEATPNYFITGGAYRCNSADWVTDPGYSYFFMSLDSSGHGEVDSTNNYYQGNANDNNLLSFADDVAYIAAALGNSGPPRTPFLQSNFYPRTVFGKEWLGNFGIGVNYKYSDYDGNGTIDINDIIDFATTLYLPKTITPHWPIVNPPNTQGPVLRLSYSTNIVSASDTVDAYLTVNTNSFPVDSIYSISMTFFDPFNFNFAASTFEIHNNNFGTLGNDLMNYSNVSSGMITLNLLLARNNNLNAALHNDTLVIFHLILNSNIMIQSRPVSFSFRAITKAGFDVGFNFVNDTLNFTNTTGINEYNTRKILIYPNPSRDICKFIFPEKVDELLVMNSLGKIVLTKNIFMDQFILDIYDFPEGIYFIKCSAGNEIYTSKIFVIH